MKKKISLEEKLKFIMFEKTLTSAKYLPGFFDMTDDSLRQEEGGNQKNEPNNGKMPKRHSRLWD